MVGWVAAVEVGVAGVTGEDFVVFQEFSWDGGWVAGSGRGGGCDGIDFAVF